MYRRRFVRSSVVGFALAVAGCSGGDGGDTPASTPTATSTPAETTAGGLSLTSPAFPDGGTIPPRFTCAGENVSPRLDVSGVPEDATTLALVVDDPDAPTEQPFVHWLLWNVPAARNAIPENVPASETVDALGGARQGTNSAGNVGYAGPCPPTDDGPHTYRFDLLALDTRLDVAAGASRASLESGVKGHALDSARLTGKFDRN